MPFCFCGNVTGVSLVAVVTYWPHTTCVCSSSRHKRVAAQWLDPLALDRRPQALPVNGHSHHIGPTFLKVLARLMLDVVGDIC